MPVLHKDMFSLNFISLKFNSVEIIKENGNNNTRPICVLCAYGMLACALMVKQLGKTASLQLEIDNHK